MHLRPHTTALLITLALITTTKTYATTYTWSGTTANFSDPTAWIGPIPSPNGSPTDQLLFPDTPPNSTYTITLDSPGPITLNTLTLGSSNNLNNAPRLTATINALSTGSLLFDGPNPTITLVPATYLDTSNPSSPYLNSYTPIVTSNVPISSTSNLTITGNGSLLIAAPLSFTGPNAQLNVSTSLTYQSNSAPTGFSQTNINNGTVIWNYAPTDATETTLAFGSGNITLNNASFQVNVPQSAPSGFIIDITNNIVIQGGGGLYAPFTESDYSLPNPVGLVRFNGNIQLNGSVELGGYVNTEYTGTIELNESGNIQPSIQYNSNVSITISGNIIDDPDPSHHGTQPLAIEGNSPINITGTHNNYSTGTDIQYGDVFVAPNSSLGTGSVSISGGTLHMSSSTNIATGQKVLVKQWGAPAISFDADPTPLIDSNSNGVLAIDTTFSTPLNLATIGNGLMVLASTNNGTYSAPTLMPDSDHIYHFDGVHSGFTTLTLVNSVLRDYDGIPSSAQFGYITLDAPNPYSGGSSIVGVVNANAPGALGTGDITIGLTWTNDAYQGRLYLTAPNAYATTAQIDLYGTLAAVGSNGSIPFSTKPLNLYPGSALVLGDQLTNNSNRYPDSMPINLHSSTFVLNGIGTTTETVGPISVSGVSSIVLINAPTTDTASTTPADANANATNPNSTTLIAASLTHEDHAVAFFVPFYITPGLFLTPTSNTTPTSQDGDSFQLAIAPTVTNGMVAPWIQSRHIYYGYGFLSQPSSFLTYNANGLAPSTYTSLPTTGGTGTEIVDIPQDTANAPIVLSTDTSIYALRIANSITNPNTGPVTLHIVSGGLIYAYSSIWTGNGYVRIDPNVDFAGAEAYINTDGDPNDGGGTLELAGIVTATNGLTKFGFGNLLLSNPNNTILGPITIHEGTLSLASLPDPTSTGPITLSNQANLNFTNDTILTRPIIITNGGSFDIIYGSISAADGKSLTIAAPITANGTYAMGGGKLLNISAPVSDSGLLNFYGDEVRIDSAVSVGGVEFFFSRTARLSGNGVLTSPTGIYFNAGTITPGDAPSDLGTLTFNTPDLELYEMAGVQFDLDPSGLSDRLLVTGSLSIVSINAENPNLTSLTLNFLSPPTGQTYTLISYSSLTGTFATINGLPANYSLDYTPTALLLLPNTSSPNSIPEPTTLTITTLLLPTLMRRRPRPI